jgi:hypothetical protein
MAYDFNGTNQYLFTPTGDIPSPTYPLTVAAWIYDAQSTNANDRTIISFGRSTTDQPLYRIQRPGGTRNAQLSVRGDSGSLVFATAVSYGSANVWAHTGGVLDASSRAVWVNGTAGTTSTVTVAQPTLDRFAIAALFRSSAANLWLGRIAEVAVWSVYLSNDEMIALSKGFKPPRIRPQSLLYYSPLIRDLQDVRAARTITNNNTATVADHPRVY